MSKRSVIVELSPSRIRVSLVRAGAPAESRSERVALGMSEDFAGSLKAAAPVLKRLTDALGATGASATVLYTSPTAAVGVFSCARAAGQTRAIEAAQLALAESADFPLESSCRAVTTIGNDRSGPGGDAQTHVLATADTDGALTAIGAMAGEAGLHVGALVPMDVPHFALTVGRALELAEEPTPPVVLYIGEHSSILAAASGGRLKFARSIALGSESLVEALAREIRAADGVPVKLSAEQAREILARIGIPARDQTVLESPRIGGDAVLPILQPVLQRWVVEIRQSLRFGLEEAERDGARFEALGPGAAVPGLCRIIADHLGIQLRDPGGQGGPASGPTEAWLDTVPRIALLPKQEDQNRSARRVRRGMLVGAAGAVLLVVADAAFTRADLSGRTEELKQSRARLFEAQTIIALRDRTVVEQAAVAQASARLKARLGAAPAWDAVMAMISAKTPTSVKLIDMQFGLDNGQPVARLAGRMPVSDQTDSRGALKAYMDGLSSVPLVRGCKLGVTQRGETDAGPVLAFEMTLSIVAFPADAPPTVPTMTSAGSQENAP